MTNEQKYKTAEERINAFRKKCGSCRVPICGSIKVINCLNNWLALEAEEEKPEPCFFCGNKYLAITKDGNNLWSVSCTACLYESSHHENRDTAIAAHNRVARAVMAAKEETK